MRKSCVFLLVGLSCSVLCKEHEKSGMYQVRDEKAFMNLVAGYTLFKDSRVHDLKLLAALMLQAYEQEAAALQKQVLEESNGEKRYFSEKEMTGIYHMGDVAYSIIKKYKKIPSEVSLALKYALHLFYNPGAKNQFFDAFNTRYETVYKSITLVYKRKTNLPARINGWNDLSQIWAKKSGAELQEIGW